MQNQKQIFFFFLLIYLFFNYKLRIFVASYLGEMKLGPVSKGIFMNLSLWNGLPLCIGLCNSKAVKHGLINVGLQSLGECNKPVNSCSKGTFGKSILTIVKV